MCCLERKSILHNASNSVGPPLFFFCGKGTRPTSLDTRFQRDLSSAGMKKDQRQPKRAHTARFSRSFSQRTKPRNWRVAFRVARNRRPRVARLVANGQKNAIRDDTKTHIGDSVRSIKSDVCTTNDPQKNESDCDERKNKQRVSKTHSGRCPHRRTRRRARVVATTRSSRPVSFAGHARKTWCLCVCVVGRV